VFVILVSDFLYIYNFSFKVPWRVNVLRNIKMDIYAILNNFYQVSRKRADIERNTCWQKIHDCVLY